MQGLSPILFACAVLGNTTYALGIIIKGQRLIGALPFLIGSIGKFKKLFEISISLYIIFSIKFFFHINIPYSYSKIFDSFVVLNYFIFVLFCIKLFF